MTQTNRGYEDLKVWHKAIELAENIYCITRAFPKEEIYGIVSQMRRSSVSIASNIAEGCARNGVKEFAQFVAIALGSTAELKTQLIIAGRIGLVETEKLRKTLEEASIIEKMLVNLRKNIANTKTT